MVARAVGSAEDEADVLVTLGMIEEYDDPANARSLYAAGRARAAAAGNLEIESRALQDLAWLEFELGNLAAARAAVRRRRRADPADRPWLVPVRDRDAPRTVLGSLRRR